MRRYAQRNDALLPLLSETQALLADKAYDAEERVLKKLNERDILPVIPSKSNNKKPLYYDKHLYKASWLLTRSGL
ncbi:hypothetical protein [Candidatus Uabimicrobium sp. HlEnr_7]|uniref:hypothetical protein n=1 Tax=Candidatus Uabimicrobium helgolandensis TaxID=3095367 RepID=UPI00355786C1